MVKRKQLIILAVLLAFALIPFVEAQGFMIGPGWTLSNDAITAPNVSVSPVPTLSVFITSSPTAQNTPTPTATETTQPTTNPTIQPIASPLKQLTPNPTVPELSGVAILALSVTLLASVLLIKKRRLNR